MLFRRRKTAELNRQDIEEAAASYADAPAEEDFYGEEPEEEDFYGEDAGEESFGDEPAGGEEYYDGEDEEEELYEDGPHEDEAYGDEELYDEESLPLSSDTPEAGPHEKMSPVETGAWDYIHGEPNEDYLTDTGNFRYELDGPEGGVFLPEEEPEERTGLPRKIHVRRKHKKHHYLLKFAICCLVIALAVTFMMSSYFNINAIEVEGNVNYTAEQIIESSGLSTGTNIFKVKTGKAEDSIEADPHISKAEISRDLPKTLHITVEERLPAAQIPYGEEFVVIDASGYILSVGEAAPGAAQLVGVTVKGEHVTAATDVSVEEGAALDEALSLLRTAGEAGIAFTWMDMSEKTVKLYFSDTLLIKGRPSVILSHIENGDVSLILKDLSDKGITEGTINAASEESFTFSPDVE